MKLLALCPAPIGERQLGRKKNRKTKRVVCVQMSDKEDEDTVEKVSAETEEGEESADKEAGKDGDKDDDDDAEAINQKDVFG